VFAKFFNVAKEFSSGNPRDRPLIADVVIDPRGIALFRVNDDDVPVPKRRTNLESLQDSRIVDVIDSGGVAFAQPPANRCNAFGIKKRRRFGTHGLLTKNLLLRCTFTLQREHCTLIVISLYSLRQPCGRNIENPVPQRWVDSIS
jgi:hypothetical protein